MFILSFLVCVFIGVLLRGCIRKVSGVIFYDKVKIKRDG